MKNKTKKQKYLVVGGAGFIGSNLVDKLVGLKHQVIPETLLLSAM